MDLPAYAMIPELKELLPSEPPRLRGIRLMALEDPFEEDEMFSSYCGQDVLYVHTRCGQCHFDGEDNYEYFKMDEWEQELDELFLNAQNDSFDCTYRDTFIKVPEDKMERYKALLEQFRKEMK